MNDSTASGWLMPVRESPVYDEDLDRLFSRWIRGVTGLPEKTVWPRWQPVQRALPSAEKNWCAFGVMNVTPDDNPAFMNQTDDSTELWRHEIVECLISFYGPAGMTLVSRFRDGLTVGQNNADLNRTGLSLADYRRIYSVPELINNQWVRRYDLTVRLRRKIIREYGVKSLLDANVKITGE
ncbi:phage neck terminator protein [Mixta intestinalis]|uniref:Phage neck terminator protein gp12-like domain-containing protein n=1 Tax=Mixta intestinalis TaxID=1615494 RepID=A0A6P1PZJ4_9GAMM|nr:hypothetical protein [Mixta intestinalis]QHM71279.1 hypothetical protein C7M51_01565 [Mixta intestinalis]